MEECCDAGIRSLVREGALEVRGGCAGCGGCGVAVDDTTRIDDDTELVVSQLGKAAIIGINTLFYA